MNLPSMRPFLSLALASILACSSSAPTISGLSITPTEITAGSAATLSGQFDFADPDGDLSDVAMTITRGSQTSTIPKAPLQGVGGQQSGKATFAALLQVPTPGPVELRVTAYDGAGNVSNELTTTVTVR
jgi:hypothetical protein